MYEIQNENEASDADFDTEEVREAGGLWEPVELLVAPFNNAYLKLLAWIRDHLKGTFVFFLVLAGIGVWTFRLGINRQLSFMCMFAVVPVTLGLVLPYMFVGVFLQAFFAKDPEDRMSAQSLWLPCNCAFIFVDLLGRSFWGRTQSLSSWVITFLIVGTMFLCLFCVAKGGKSLRVANIFTLVSAVVTIGGLYNGYGPLPTTRFPVENEFRSGCRHVAGSRPGGRGYYVCDIVFEANGKTYEFPEYGVGEDRAYRPFKTFEIRHGLVNTYHLRYE